MTKKERLEIENRIKELDIELEFLNTKELYLKNFELKMVSLLICTIVILEVTRDFLNNNLVNACITVMCYLIYLTTRKILKVKDSLKEI